MDLYAVSLGARMGEGRRDGHAITLHQASNDGDLIQLDTTPPSKQAPLT